MNQVSHACETMLPGLVGIRCVMPSFIYHANYNASEQKTFRAPSHNYVVWTVTDY